MLQAFNSHLFFRTVIMTTAKPDYQRQSEPSQDNNPHLGLLLVDEGLITANQLQEALQLQKESPQNKDNSQYLGEILTNKKYISTEQLRFIMTKHDKKTRLGEILLRCKAITEQELEFALTEQKKNGGRIGEILLKRSIVTDEILLNAGVDADADTVGTNSRMAIVYADKVKKIKAFDLQTISETKGRYGSMDQDWAERFGVACLDNAAVLYSEQITYL